jgi:hypothetical protein
MTEREVAGAGVEIETVLDGTGATEGKRRKESFCCIFCKLASNLFIFICIS